MNTHATHKQPATHKNMTLPLAVTQLSPPRRYQCILVCIFLTSVLLTLFRYYMDGLNALLQTMPNADYIYNS